MSDGFIAAIIIGLLAMDMFVYNRVLDRIYRLEKRVDQLRFAEKRRSQ